MQRRASGSRDGKRIGPRQRGQPPRPSHQRIAGRGDPSGATPGGIEPAVGRARGGDVALPVRTNRARRTASPDARPGGARGRRGWLATCGSPVPGRRPGPRRCPAQTPRTPSSLAPCWDPMADGGSVAEPGDRRAWDAVALLPEGKAAFEAETRLLDVQALDRRIALKRRDGSIERVVLLIADSAANRRAMELHRAGLRASFPLDTRAVLRSLRSGHAPATSGIVLL